MEATFVLPWKLMEAYGSWERLLPRKLQIGFHGTSVEVVPVRKIRHFHGSPISMYFHRYISYFRGSSFHDFRGSWMCYRYACFHGSNSSFHPTSMEVRELPSPTGFHRVPPASTEADRTCGPYFRGSRTDKSYCSFHGSWSHFRGSCRGSGPRVGSH